MQVLGCGFSFYSKVNWMENSNFALKRVKSRILLLEKSEIFWNRFRSVNNFFLSFLSLFCNDAIGSIIIVYSVCLAGNISKSNKVIQILNDPKHPVKHYIASGRSKRDSTPVKRTI